MKRNLFESKRCRRLHPFRWYNRLLLVDYRLRRRDGRIHILERRSAVIYPDTLGLYPPPLGIKCLLMLNFVQSLGTRPLIYLDFSLFQGFVKLRLWHALCYNR